MFACIHIPGLQPADSHLLTECAGAFSPHIEKASTDWVLADIRGLGRLGGGAQDIAQAIAKRAASLHLSGARIAIAYNPQAALCAARGYEGVTVIPRGEEQRWLGKLQLDLLDPDETLRETLNTWGIHTLGELAALPESGIAERLGPDGLKIYRQARGADLRPLVPTLGEERFEESEDLEYPLELLEPLSFLLGRMLNNICARLRSHGLAANELTLTLRLENRADYTRMLRLPFVGREAATFLKLLQYDLSAHPPEAPIVGVHVSATPAPPRPVQGGLFTPLAPEPEKLELTLARILSIVGEGNAGTPVLLNTHRPGAFRIVPFSSQPKAMKRPPAVLSTSPQLAIRLFRPPVPARVEAPFGVPGRIRSRWVNGCIRTFAGPWRISGDWWTSSAWLRDEWDVAIDGGGLYRLYREASGEWFIDGNYD